MTPSDQDIRRLDYSGLPAGIKAPREDSGRSCYFFPRGPTLTASPFIGLHGTHTQQGSQVPRLVSLRPRPWDQAVRRPITRRSHGRLRRTRSLVPGKHFGNPLVELRQPIQQIVVSGLKVKQRLELLNCRVHGSLRMVPILGGQTALLGSTAGGAPIQSISRAIRRRRKMRKRSRLRCRDKIPNNPPARRWDGWTDPRSAV